MASKTLPSSLEVTTTLPFCHTLPPLEPSGEVLLSWFAIARPNLVELFVRVPALFEDPKKDVVEAFQFKDFQNHLYCVDLVTRNTQY